MTKRINMDITKYPKIQNWYTNQKNPYKAILLVLDCFINEYGESDVFETLLKKIKGDESIIDLSKASNEVIQEPKKPQKIIERVKKEEIKKEEESIPIIETKIEPQPIEIKSSSIADEFGL